MRAHVSRAYKLVDEIDKWLCGDADLGPADKVNAKRYGEVYITQRLTVIFRCAVCNTKHCTYEKFLEHIFRHYHASKQRPANICRSDMPAAVHENQQSKICSEDDSSAADIRSIEFVEEAECFEKPISIEVDKRLEVCASVEATAEATMASVNPLSVESTPRKACLEPCAAPLPLRKHIRKLNRAPESERKYKCEICGKAFREVTNMRAHWRRHTGEKAHACTQCEMRFYTRGELASHVRHRHTGERPYVCASCGDSFQTNSKLRRHEKRHTNYRPYKCDYCDKRCYDAGQLQDHLLVHTKEQNHICSVCESRFTRARALRQHMKLHANAREYVCNMCEMAFNQLPALWLHKRNKHRVIFDSKSRGRNNPVRTAAATAE